LTGAARRRSGAAKRRRRCRSRRCAQALTTRA